MIKGKYNSEKLALYIILFVALWMRLYKLGEFSISADELSVLKRLNFDSFTGLINGGVKPDGHPALVQVFLYYYTKLFGQSTFAIRLPSAVLSVVGLWYLFRVVMIWLNNSFVALLVLIVISFSEFHLTYSQFARPYAYGFCFTMMFTYYWTRVVFNKPGTVDKTGFVLTGILSVYTHYFSFLQIALTGFIGLFLLTKDNWKSYLLLCACIVALFLPYLPVFRVQLSMGGVGGADGWLAVPDYKFITNHFQFILNGSWWYGVFLILTVFILITLARNSKIPRNKFTLISILLFILPIGVGFIYSIKINPVLQNSVLFFSMPFGFITLFSVIPNNSFSGNFKRAIIVLYSVVPFYIVCFFNSYYSEFRFGEVKELMKKGDEWEQKYKGVITQGLNVDDEFFLKYFGDQYNYKTNYSSYRNDGGEQLAYYYHLLDTSSGKYFSYAWTSRFSPPEIPFLIRDKFPYLVERKYYRNAGYYFFSKEKQSNSRIDKEDLIKEFNFNFEIRSAMLNGNFETVTIDTNLFGSKRCMVLGKNREYSPVFKATLGEMADSKTDIINVCYDFFTDDSLAFVNPVIEMEGKTHPRIWLSNSSRFFKPDQNKVQRLYFAVLIPEEAMKTDKVFIYFWNNSGKKVFIDNWSIRTEKGNPKIWGGRKW